MNIPGSLDQLVLFVLFVLPGITFTTVRVALVGWKSPDYGVSARVLEALFVSALFDGLYLLMFGELVVDKAKLTPDPLDWIITPNIAIVLAALVGLPALVSCAFFLRPNVYRTEDEGGKKRLHVQWRGNYRSVPQAWDFKVLDSMREGQFARVRMEDGVYFGGWYSGGSLASTYPHGRDLFIELQWRMGKKGEFLSPMDDSRGVWIPISDKTIVEWIAAPQQEEETAT